MTTPKPKTERTLTMELPVDIDDDAIEDRKTKLAKLVQRETELEAQARQAASKFREELRPLKDDKRKLAAEIDARTSTMAVPCVEKFDFATGKARTYRTDLAVPQFVAGSERDLTDKERQVPMIDVDDDDHHPDGTPLAGDTGEKPKRGRGRPPGTKNKPKK